MMAANRRRFFNNQGITWALATILFTLTAGLSILYLTVPAVDIVLERDIRERAELWQRRVILHLDNSAQTFDSQVLSKAEVEFLTLLPEASDVYRFKLLDPQGSVFWSTRPSDIGIVATEPFFQSEVASGKVSYAHETKPASEIDDLLLHARNTNSNAAHEVAEVYVPVMQNGMFIGAIAFYSDITEIRDLFITRVQLTLITLTGIVVVMLIFFGSFIWKSNKSRYRALQTRSQNERELMDRQLHLAQEVKLLGELNEWLQSSRSLDELFDMVVKFMGHMLPDCSGSVYVYSNSRDVLDGVSSWNGGEVKRHIRPEGCWGLRRGRTYTYGASEVDFVCEHAEPHDDTPYFCFPILAHGETVGLMHLKKLEGASEERFLKSRKLAQMSAEQISMAIANVRMRDQLQEQSLRDPLTGLFNRRHMVDRLRHFVDLSGKKSRLVNVIYLDIDHFKRFNDTHGHDAGDFVLRAVGEILDDSCSNDEVACRMGGEEFVLLWPDVEPKELRKRVDSLCVKISGLSLNYQSKTLPKITASVGVANAPEHGTLPQDVIRAADEAMYHAKNTGRDRVVYAGEENVNLVAGKSAQKDPPIAAE